ncbi:MAG: PIN domain-containing protein [Bacilli bacterium]|nr:PIN domain-containing protein [Bacilli bacterium]
MRVLVDTNVFLEQLLHRERYNDVDKFFFLAAKQSNQTIVTSMSLRDIGYALHRQRHSEEEARKAQLQVYCMVSKVAGVSADAAIDSLYSDAKDFEDALQVRAAEEAMCMAIVTFNKKDYQKANIPVFTPMEICELWSK